MRMTAAVMYEQGLPHPYVKSQPFHIEQVDIEGPGEDEVLVEVQAAGLCHSDLSVVAGLRRRPLPIVGGHEGAGIVREVGRNVKDVQPGDHVVLTGVAGCGHCRPCSKLRPALCETVTASRSAGQLGSGFRRLSKDGKPVNHYSGLSVFAQYAVVMPNSLIKMDKDIPFEDAAIFGCAVITGVGSVFNAAHVQPGASVAVIGLGGVGLNAIMACKIAGASKIIGIDIREDKFALARTCGATDTVLSSDPDAVAKIREMTNGGVDFAFEVVGIKPTVALALAITAKGGELIGIGLGRTDDMYEYKHTVLCSEDKVIRGSLMGSCVPARDLPTYLGYYKDGRLPVGLLRSEQIKFDQLNNALDLLEGGGVVRQILRPHW